MDQQSKDFFKKLCLMPGISGFEERASALWRDHVKPLADSVHTDVNGSVVATLKGKSEKSSVLLLGHIDQLGLIVRYIDDNGLLYFAPVGTIDLVTLTSQRVTVLGPKGDIPGLVGKTAIHLTPRSERNTKGVNVEEMWVDIGAKSKVEAEEYAPIGTPIQVGEDYLELLNDRFATRMDNRFGCYVAAEVLRRLTAKKADLFPTVHAGISVQEETGIGAAGAGPITYHVMPSALIAIDVNHAVDTPGVEKRHHGDARMGGGPVLNVGVMASNKLASAIQQAAKDAGIPLQLEYNSGRSYTDADAGPGTRSGVPSVYVGNPIRYMHNTVEMGQYSDIDQTEDLLEAFLLSIKSEVDYTP